MSVLETEDPRDHRLALAAHGLLRTFNEAGVVEAADVHVARRVTALAEEPDDSVALAVALAVRAVRGGSVCVDLTTIAQDTGLDHLPWPETTAWLAALHASPLTGTPAVLRLLDDRLLYLDRYWR
jgi:exodeoxyribonuclease V alpha subunit